MCCSRIFGPEPLRFLQPLAVLPPLPPNVSVAQLEVASLWSRYDGPLEQGAIEAPEQGLPPQLVAGWGIQEGLERWVNHSTHPALEAELARLSARHDPILSPDCGVPTWRWPSLSDLMSLRGLTQELRLSLCDEV